MPNTTRDTDADTGTSSSADRESPSTTAPGTNVIPEIVRDKDDRYYAVRGSNPATGAGQSVVERVTDDETTSALALVLRQAPVGTFHQFSADLRSVEASSKAALDLVEAFERAGMHIEVQTPEQYKKQQEEFARQERVRSGQEPEKEEGEGDQSRRRNRDQGEQPDTTSRRAGALSGSGHRTEEEQEAEKPKGTASSSGTSSQENKTTQTTSGTEAPSYDQAKDKNTGTSSTSSSSSPRRSTSS